MSTAALSGKQVEEVSRLLSRLERRLEEHLPDGDPSLSRGQAAAYLGIHPKTLAALTVTDEQAGKVTGYQRCRGGRWFYRRSALDRYRDSLAPATRAPRPTASTDWGA